MKGLVAFLPFLSRGFFILILRALPMAAWAVFGDVDNDSDIDIIDALLIAQYYVELDPEGFYLEFADVSGDGDITIIDALLVAQYYVGLIDEFPVNTSTAAPTNAPSPVP
jgi:hypothetical protein